MRQLSVIQARLVGVEKRVGIGIYIEGRGAGLADGLTGYEM